MDNKITFDNLLKEFIATIDHYHAMRGADICELENKFVKVALLRAVLVAQGVECSVVYDPERSPHHHYLVFANRRAAWRCRDLKHKDWRFTYYGGVERAWEIPI